MYLYIYISIYYNFQKEERGGINFCLSKIKYKSSTDTI